MALIIHIIIALSSLAFTALLFLQPSKAKFRTHYALVGLTLASGTYLVVSTNTAMLQACTSGLTYLALVSLGTVAARYRLTRAAQGED